MCWWFCTVLFYSGWFYEFLDFPGKSGKIMFLTLCGYFYITGGFDACFLYAFGFPRGYFA
jgi:hypothetical protein